MSSITLKNVPPDLLEALREEAAREHRSVNRHAVLLLAEGVRDAPSSAASVRPKHVRVRPAAITEREGQIAVWRSLAGAWGSKDDLDTEVRALRRARTGGRRVTL